MLSNSHRNDKEVLCFTSCLSPFLVYLVNAAHSQRAVPGVYTQLCLPLSTSLVPTIDDYNTVCHWLDMGCSLKHTHALLFTHLWRWHCEKRAGLLLEQGPCPTLSLQPPSPSSYTKPPSNHQTTEERRGWAFEPLKPPARPLFHSCLHTPSHFSHLVLKLWDGEQGELWVQVHGRMCRVRRGRKKKPLISPFHLDVSC